MKPFVAPNDDYVLMTSWEEMQEIRDRAINAELLLEGEIPTGKILRFQYREEQQKKLQIEFIPKEAGWNGIEQIIVTCNDKAIEDFENTGKATVSYGRDVLYLIDEHYV